MEVTYCCAMCSNVLRFTIFMNPLKSHSDRREITFFNEVAVWCTLNTTKKRNFQNGPASASCLSFHGNYVYLSRLTDPSVDQPPGHVSPPVSNQTPSDLLAALKTDFLNVWFPSHVYNITTKASLVDFQFHRRPLKDKHVITEWTHSPALETFFKISGYVDLHVCCWDFWTRHCKAQCLTVCGLFTIGFSNLCLAMGGAQSTVCSNSPAVCSYANLFLPAVRQHSWSLKWKAFIPGNTFIYWWKSESNKIK